MQGGISYIKSLPAKFIGWGKDMIMGLVKGITRLHRGCSRGREKCSLGDCLLHALFPPDIGPLRMYEQWMPDFMAGLSRGITDNLWMVEDAAERLSGATAEPMQVAVAGTLRSNNRFGNTADTWQPGGMTVNLNNEFHTHDSLSESELTREAESMAQRLKWAIP